MPETHRVQDKPGTAWRAVVDVSVATLWSKPAALRPMDAPSAANPVDIPLWLSRMTVADRRWLVGRVQTQVLYGSAVTVLKHRGRWSYVVVRGQPTQLDPRGYPGWLPTRQLTGNLSMLDLVRTHPVAVVTARTAWLRDPTTLKRRLQVSFATRLPIVGRRGDSDLVATPDGGRLAVRIRKVAEYASLGAIHPSSRRALVRAAKGFLGLPYLWGGVSGFGFDCSGFTYASTTGSESASRATPTSRPSTARPCGGRISGPATSCSSPARAAWASCITWPCSWGLGASSRRRRPAARSGSCCCPRWTPTTRERGATSDPTVTARKESPMTTRPIESLTTEPLRAEHRELMIHVEQIRAAARELPDLSPEERDVLVGRIMTFVETTLAPHARREEEVLYRVIGDILGQPRATEPMIHDHQIILETAHALGQTDAGDVRITQELLYRLYGLIVAHFRKEEDLYLPILDSHPERAAEVIGELGVAPATLTRSVRSGGVPPLPFPA